MRKDFGQEGVFTEDLRWLKAWRIWNDYDDKHTKDLEEKGDILKKVDNPDSSDPGGGMF